MADLPSTRTIGRRIRAARESAGRRISHLACVLKTSPERLYDLEEGRDRPQPAELAGLAQALNQPIDFFLDPFSLVGEEVGYHIRLAAAE